MSEQVIEASSDHQIILGDCLAGMGGLADGSVDVTLSDPPYEESCHSGALARFAGKALVARKHLPGEALSFAPADEEMRAVSAAEMARVTRRWVIVFCQAEAIHLWRAALEGAGLVYRRAGIWVKPDAMPQFSGDRPGMGYESIVISHAKGKSRWNAGGKCGVYTFNKNDPERFDHPTQKPLPLMDALVRDFTDPGELVLDPFAGSGTTGVACKRLGRRFLGFERDPKFHAAAVKRLDGTRQQFEFAPRPAKPKQMGLIK